MKKWTAFAAALTIGIIAVPGSSCRSGSFPAEDARPKPASEAETGKGPALAEKIEPGSLRIVTPDGGVRLLSKEDIARLGRKKIGDLELVPLAALCPGEKEVEAEAAAADGFKRTVGPSRIGSAYLEPKRLGLFIIKDKGDPFVARDIVQITFRTTSGTRALSLVMAGKTYTFASKELSSLAESGAVSFEKILKKAGGVPKGVETFLLTAADGYQRKIPADALTKGILHPDGMWCSFSGRPSADQIRNLAGIEAQ